ncbi:MAG: ECF transporter S component [Clostridiales bacterium]|nr:ECF transporter S component [Clostridiales bacterium]
MAKKVVSTQMMVRVALLAAISFILFKFLEIPAVAFYKLDLSGIPALLAGFAMGPLAAILTLAIKDLLAVVVGSATGGIGELADFLMLSCLVLATAVPYQRKRNKQVVLWGMVAGTVLMTIAGVLLNYYVLIPLYTRFMPEEAIIAAAAAAVPFAGIDSLVKVVLFVTAPFNIVKGAIISVLTYYLYRYMGPVLKKGRL